ncbi:MAG: tetratricopeptide repeat protein [Bacteroidales bacterium]|jgi:tetratricopeptide (TPR) repeat protein|nr:tetratricopeptide repeat protein [Bacteroidales bacterium]
MIKDRLNKAVFFKIFGTHSAWISSTFVFIIFVFVTLASNSLQAEELTLEQQYEIAHQQYNEANFDSALVVYRNIYEAGYTSAELLYNIGNTYYKLRQIPSAILFYERALKLAPNDPDIIHNLAIANSRIIDKIEPVPQLFFKNWWETFYKMFSADWWAIISLIFLALFLSLLFIFIISENRSIRKVSFFSGLLILLITIGTFGMASQKYYYTKSINEAIVFTPTITVKSSPSASSVDLFVLHEGTKVSLLDEVDGWKEIKIANGSVGWMPSESLKGI